jgi:hypothetical protein
MMETFRKMNPRVRDLSAVLIVSLVSGALVTTASQRGAWLPGFASASLLLFIGLALITLAYRKFKGDHFLAWMILLSMVLRLGLGIALFQLLPVYGYDTDQQKGGYVFFDAYRREAQAVDIARSDQPIWSALGGKYATDQYGGYLMLTSAVHRYLSPDDYRPQLILIVSAAMCTLGLPFIWAAVKRKWNDRTARIAALIYVLFPECILLSASQMREPLLIGFSAVMVGAFAEWLADGNKKNWIWLAAGLVGLLLVSPGILLPVLAFLAGWWLLDRGKVKISWKILVPAAAVLVVGVFILANALGRQGHVGGGTPFEVIYNWFRSASNWDAYLLKQGSGRIQDIFKVLPAALQLPFVVIYGVLQPVLPAALLDPAQPLWTGLSSFLALGWYLLLPVLIYGILVSIRMIDRAERKWMVWLGLIVWVWILVASLRAGGDQWDNPRYRTILMPLICLFAARVWDWGRENHDRWLGRIFILEGIFLTVFTEWYVSRIFAQIALPRLPFLTMIAAIAAVWGICVAGWLVWDRWKQK